MFEIFTEPARSAILEAQAEAVERRDDNIGCEHLLVGLLREGGGFAAEVLAERAVTLDRARAVIDELVGPRPPEVHADHALATLGIDLDRVHARLAATFGPGALKDPPPPFTTHAREALELAVAEASRMRQRHVGTEHELLGLAGVTEGLAAKVLERLGVDLAALVEDVRARAAPDERRVWALLAERPLLERMTHQIAEGRRDDAAIVLQELGAGIQRALSQEQEEGVAATRRLASQLETLLDDARRQLDALRSV